MLDHKKYLLRGVELSKRAVLHGNNPFGALLVDSQGMILLEQENIEISERDCTGHAETVLMRNASKRYDRDFLATCSIHTTGEPCVMCAGAIYWGNVLKGVYGITEKQILAMTGNDPRNPTLAVDCRTVFASGQKKIAVIGPIPDVADAILDPHRTYWTKKI
jgi:tRNA(Arg) A34 adenosine deaminase TadA